LGRGGACVTVDVSRRIRPSGIQVLDPCTSIRDDLHDHGDAAQLGHTASAVYSTALAGYAAVILATFLFFVPELIELTQSTYSTSVDAGLTQRARTWEVLSLVRLAFLFSLAGIMLLGLSKPEQRFAKAA
jgi:hypothetical protein